MQRLKVSEADVFNKTQNDIELLDFSNLKKIQKMFFKFATMALMTLFFAFSPLAIAQNEQPLMVDTTSKSQMELIQNDVNVKDIDIEPINTDKVKKSIVPDSKNEGKKVIGLFLKTMAAVLLCAVLLYIVLLFVKKFYGSAFVSEEFDEYEALDLSTPTNKTDALKSFLNRTK